MCNTRRLAIKSSAIKAYYTFTTVDDQSPRAALHTLGATRLANLAPKDSATMRPSILSWTFS